VTSVEPFADVVWDGHVVLVYSSERERRLAVAAWLCASFTAGAKVFYVEPPYERDERSLLGILAEHDIDDLPARSGQLEVLTATPTAYDEGWQRAMSEEALAAGYRTVRWSGEAVTAWATLPPDVHLGVEQETDRGCRAQQLSALCQYPADLPHVSLQAVCAAHSGGLRQAKLQAYPRAGGLRLVGAADASNERLLRAAVSAVESEQHRLVIDLSGLTFLDVAGARGLFTGTTAHRLRGDDVRLRGARGQVHRVLSLLGLDREPRLQLEER
jgi:anti-anti-sigma factor